MDFPQVRERRLPAIHIDRNPPDPFAAPPASSFARFSSGAMSIPGSHPDDAPPPPLPPPRFPFHDNPGTDMRDYHREPSSFSPREPSLFGSLDDYPSYRRRDSALAFKVEKDEGYASLSSTRSKDSLPAEFGLHHNRFQFRSSADAYGDRLKNKLNPIRSFDNKSPPSRSILSASTGDVHSRRPANDARFPPPLTVPTSLPIHTRSSVLGSPERFTHTPLHSAVSPRSAPFQLNGHGDYRSPNDVVEVDSSPRHHTRRTNSGSIPDDAASSTQGAYDMHGVEDMEIEETTSMRKLRIDDSARSEYPAVGLKRRASSPLGDEPMLHAVPSQSDLLRRRDVTSRGSPTPRLSSIPQGSISSVSSAGRNGSFASAFSMAAGTGVPSASAHGRRSPGGMSPGAMSPITSEPSCGSPYSTPLSLNPSPRISISKFTHQRTISECRPMMSPRKPTEVLKPNGTKIQGFLMCECCPKKPKKFETHEELSAHESEKQYECSFCGNRFKNKNEAERHQNSLHVRRHSWSCKALSGYDRAFHESTNRPGEADACGYCGEEFLRTGVMLPSGPRQITETDWDERIRHLTLIHKFRECNSSKKFYRADHFRQHLKHSHAGTSGKWTNMLENACMLDEEPPPN